MSDQTLISVGILFFGVALILLFIQEWQNRRGGK